SGSKGTSSRRRSSPAVTSVNSKKRWQRPDSSTGSRREGRARAGGRVTRAVVKNCLIAALKELMKPATIRTLLTLLLLCGTAAAARADRIDDYIQEQMKEKRIPGLSLAVVRGG